MRIDILDVNGRRIETVLDGIQPAGTARVSWNAARQPAGAYFCRMSTAGVLLTQRLIVLR